MADNKKQQLTIWGRANSVNVQKVLWCLAELDLAYERIDAGMQFGKNTEAAYLAMNPNGRVPTLVEGDYVLWESNSVMRYLCMAYGESSPIYPLAAEGARRRRPLARLDAVDAAAGRPAGVLGAGADAARQARHGRDPEGRRRGSRGVADRRGATGERGASSKAISSRSPTSRSAPMRGAGWGRRRHASRNCRTSNAGSRNSRPAAASAQFIAPPMT